jgi:hypothetical protein
MVRYMSMNDTSNTYTIKRGRGRPKKAVTNDAGEELALKKVGLPAMIEPTEHDIRDELSYLESYNYSRYSEE